MPALVKTAEGTGHVELTERPVPTPADREVLLEVAYCGICGSDLHIQEGRHPCSPPVTMGHEFSGDVVSVGQEVTSFEQGDRVAFRRPWNPFPGVDGDGGFATYMTAPADAVWRYPDGLPATAATQFETVRPPMTMVRDVAELEPGERVVVSGPGPIGLLVTNVAALDGAGNITVIGTEADADVRLPLAERLGADQTVVFDDTSLAAIAERPPDVWFETSGAAAAIEAAVDHVAPGGRVICSGLGDGPWDVDMQRVARRNLSIHGQWGGDSSYVEPAAQAMLDGDLDVEELITDIYSLSDWENAFEQARAGRVGKALLEPPAA